MQKPVCNYSLEQKEEICPKAKCHLTKETEPPEEEVDLSGSSNSESDILQACDTMTLSTGMDSKMRPVDCTWRRHYTASPVLLKVSLKEHEESYSAPFQFDRHALGRISTSPTLRRLRNSLASVSQVSGVQECFDGTRLGSQRQHYGSLQHICKSTPQCTMYSSSSFSSPSCIHEKLLPYKESSETPLAALESFGPASKTPHQKDHPSNGSSDSLFQNLWKVNTATLPEREQVSQPKTTQHECVQKKEPPASSSCRSGERRRSSVVISLPGLEVFPGDLLVSDAAANCLKNSSLLFNAESKKSRWPFSRKGASKDKQKQMSDLETCLSTIKIADCSGYEFHSFKNETWHAIIKTYRAEQKDADDPLEMKKKEAVWELFTSECTYFLDHLLVLKMIFLNTLKYLQNQDFLLDVDLWRLFANLEELNQLSLSFVTDFFKIVKDHVTTSESSMDFISVLTKYFQGNLCQTHQIYCLHYTSAIFYLENLRQREDFGIYLKQWCEQNEQCKRLHLPELLVAPLHRLTRYPLLLNNIWKRSADAAQKVTICSIKEKVEKALRDLEGKVKWLDNFQKFRQLQEVIIWPALWDRDKRFFVPECLKHILRENTSENILSSANRQLVHEGKLTLAESTRILDVYLFLFNDFLLITKTKRNKKKYGGSDIGSILLCPSFTPELQSLVKDGGSFIVLDQPIPLDRLTLKNIDPFHVTVLGLQNAFLIQHENRYQQCIGVFLLQAQTEIIKKTWMSQIETAVSTYANGHKTQKSSFFCLSSESSEI